MNLLEGGTPLERKATLLPSTKMGTHYRVKVANLELMCCATSTARSDAGVSASLDPIAQGHPSSSAVPPVPPAQDCLEHDLVLIKATTVELFNGLESASADF